MPFPGFKEEQIIATLFRALCDAKLSKLTTDIADTRFDTGSRVR